VLLPPFQFILYREDEPITPHQISFLKLVDSYLRHQNTASGLHDYSFLWEAFLQLCSYSQGSLQRSLGLEPLLVQTKSRTNDDPTDPETHTFEKGLRELDLRLPEVAAALVLLSQCLTTILLSIQNAANTEKPGHAGYSAVVDATQAPGFIESLIGVALNIAFPSCIDLCVGP
jgi:ataxin-10